MDDIDGYNRVRDMLSIRQSRTARENDDVEGFGWRWDNDFYYPADSGFRGGPGSTAIILEGELNQTFAFGGVASGATCSAV